MNSHPPFSEPLLLACKCIPHTKYEKSTIEIPVSLFFHNIGPNLVQLLPQRPHPRYFFWLIFSEICKGIQLILITCVASAVLKKSW